MIDNMKSQDSLEFYGFVGNYGGDRYSVELAKRLAEKKEINEYRAIRSQGIRTIISFIKLIFHGNLFAQPSVIRPFAMPIYRRNMIVIFHHYDPKETPFVPRVIEFIDLLILRTLNRFFEIRFVAVSKYWEEWLGSKGFGNIFVLYNECGISRSKRMSRLSISRKYGFDIGKKWVFLGSANEKKGGHEILSASSPSDREHFEFIASGSQKDRCKREFKLANVSYIAEEDLFSFLSECEWVVANSRLREGWCRLVIEAGLAGSAVVGSGVAGMAEALGGVGGKTCVSAEHALELIRTEGIGNSNQSENFNEYLKKRNSYIIEKILTTWV